MASVSHLNEDATRTRKGSQTSIHSFSDDQSSKESSVGSPVERESLWLF